MRHGRCYCFVSSTAVIFPLDDKTLIQGSLKGKEGCYSRVSVVRFSVRNISIICGYKNYTVIAKTAAYVIEGLIVSHVNFVQFK
jgi:hypothetical protein